MPSLLAPAKAQPGANMHEQDLFEIKRILRQCDIDPQDILAAKDKIQLVDLAHKNGIKQVPDEWSIQKIKARRQGDKQPAPPAGLMAPYPKSKPPPTKRAQLHERQRISYPSSTPKPTSPKQPAPEQPTGDGPSTPSSSSAPSHRVLAATNRSNKQPAYLAATKSKVASKNGSNNLRSPKSSKASPKGTAKASPKAKAKPTGAEVSAATAVDISDAPVEEKGEPGQGDALMAAKARRQAAGASSNRQQPQAFAIGEKVYVPRSNGTESVAYISDYEPTRGVYTVELDAIGSGVCKFATGDFLREAPRAAEESEEETVGAFYRVV